jgi:hypothetical protein
MEKNMNGFIKENIMGAGTSYTENGALSYATIGSELLDQFGKAGTARARNYSIVWDEQARLWAENPELALKFPFYLRMITRKDNIIGGGSTEKVQRGQGARDEAFKRLLWIAAYHKDEFYRNLWLLPVVGSWKDLWTLMYMATDEDIPVSEFKLDLDKFFGVLAEGISDSKHVDLVKKYMPRIRSYQKCNTKWAKETNRLAILFAKFAGWTPEEYRSFKSTGRAHEFQRVICSGLYSSINWNAIPGKALLNLVNGRFISNHSLNDSYMEWLDKQPAVKFNGYPFELGAKIYRGSNLFTIKTVDKQFENLVQTGLSDNGAITGNVLCALDTSGSMSCTVNGAGNITSFDVCVSLGIYFAELNKGAFHNYVAMFDNISRLHKLPDGTFSEKIADIRNTTTAWGGTNFQSLIDLIVKTRKAKPEIPLDEFPQTLLVVSDMQFNPTGGEETNYELAMSKLRECFPDEFVDNFKIVWWYCAGRPTKDFPSTMDHAGTYMFSGFDPSVISFLLGGNTKEKDGNVERPSMEEIIQDAFNQEVLALVH